MPGASVKMGPVRVGSGCCVVLVVPVLIVVALFFALGGVAAAKRTSNKQVAIQAVKREIARKYPLLDVFDKVADAHATVTCESVSKTRFTCEWYATNNLHEEATGSARVVVYSKGAQATLYDTQCTASLGRCGTN
jgi:hypothetical protein